MSPLRTQALQSLSWLPWNSSTPRNEYSNTIPVHKLATFLNKDWMTTDQELIMLDMLRSDMSSEMRDDVAIEDTSFLVLLTVAYKNQDSYALESGYRWIRERGEALTNGRKSMMATIVNQDNIHWVALVISFVDHQVQYGDSQGNPITPELKCVINWWVSYHTQGNQFSYNFLPIATQTDSHSCGILAWDALRHALLPSKPDLIQQCDVEAEQLRLYLRIISPYPESILVSNLSVNKNSTTHNNIIGDCST
ncbi:hypothetical protein BJ165DRAFT_1352847 [Panaeolus papilionaceus]|nr:hypothetical protein BJ165DRAFT_1352847 [Panaeolus papilionaceus]